MSISFMEFFTSDVGAEQTIDAAAFALEFMQKTAKDPVDMTGELEGQYAAPVEQVLQAILEQIKRERETQYAYDVYSQTLRDLSHFALSTHFLNHAMDENEHMLFLTRRAAVLGGAVTAPPIEPPESLTDATQIVLALIRYEQEGIQGWRTLRELVGDQNPMRFKIEEYLAVEQEHLDELIQLLPPELSPRPILANKTAEDEEVARGESRARTNAAATAEKHRYSKGERYGDLAGRAFGLALGGAGGHALKGAPELQALTTLGGAFLGQAIGGRAGKEVGRELDASRFQKKAGDLLTFYKKADEATQAATLEGTEDALPSQDPMSTPSPDQDPLGAQGYAGRELLGRRAEALQEADYYRNQYQAAQQQTAQAQQQMQALQQQVQQLQQQSEAAQQQVQQLSQQNQLTQDMAVQHAMLAQQKAQQAFQQALQSQEELLQQQQLNLELRQGWSQVRQQALQIASMNPPAATLGEQQQMQMQQQMMQQQQMQEAMMQQAAQGEQGAPEEQQAAPQGGGSSGSAPKKEKSSEKKASMPGMGNPFHRELAKRAPYAAAGALAGLGGALYDKNRDTAEMEQAIQQKSQEPGSFQQALQLAGMHADLAVTKGVQNHPGLGGLGAMLAGAVGGGIAGPTIVGGAKKIVRNVGTARDELRKAAFLRALNK